MTSLEELKKYDISSNLDPLERKAQLTFYNYLP